MVYTTPVPPGTMGKITRIDGVGLMHVRWDVTKKKPLPIKGLCVDPDLDTFEII